MVQLNDEARFLLQGHDITETDWARYWHGGKTAWGGDACGCPDDRCIGYHHVSTEPCGCLRVLIREYDEAQAEAAAIWERHQTGDPAAVQAGEAWVRSRYEYGLVDWSFEVSVDGEEGISISTEKHRQWRLVWVSADDEEDEQ